ncbi:MAG: hypothetical protein JXP73_19755 [Deltaproteobacteria bacterium]|nr:hypothetical protein [Deltaproteobacteria bacterium]
MPFRKDVRSITQTAKRQPGRSAPRLVAAIFFLAATGTLAGRAAAEPKNLLAGLRPTKSYGVKHAERLTDGLLSNEGDEWLTDVTSRFSSSRSFVEYDLGSPQTFRCVLVQADNNDVYFMYASLDGQSWQQIWRVGTETGAGMRARTTKLDLATRYLRLSATGGDALYSVSEIAAYAECPPVPWPSDLPHAHGIPAGDATDTKVLVFGILAGAFVLFHRRKGNNLQYVLLFPVFGALWMLVAELVDLYPFFNQEPPLRALAAGLAALVVLKEAFLAKRWPPHKAVSLATLGFSAFVAFGTYYHFGMPQFFDQAKGRRTLVHTWDMRHYYPVAKYFPELRFDGLYLGSLAAYIDNTPGFSPDKLRNVHLRDLRDAEMRTGTEVAAELPGIRARFSPERWEEFKRDMKYFSDTMGGTDYLNSMQDHGGNATPVWILPAYFMFNAAPAGELIISLAGLIDPILVLFFFYVLYRTFGLRVMLYVMVIWGATDFYNFGSNLMGSTLRQDWLVALGLGACALKKGRYALGGVLVAYGGLIRAFPAMATFFFLVPLGWFAFDAWLARRKLPTRAEWREGQRPALRAFVGAAICVTVLVALTSAIFGVRGSWVAWKEKIEVHATGPSTNNVGLRNVMAFSPSLSAKALAEHRRPGPWGDWGYAQRMTFASRRPLFYAILLLATALALLACRGRRLEEASLIGLLTIPFYFYPSNYYCHFVFLLPLVVIRPKLDRDRTFAIVFLVLAAQCIGQYFTLAEGWTDLRYTYQSFLLLIGFGIILFVLAWESLKLAPLRKPQPAPAEGEHVA